MNRALAYSLMGAVLLLASPIFAPQLLAFPYSASIGKDRIYSEAPISDADLGAVIKRANALVSASPIAVGDEPRKIFLTDGGWRWRWLALNLAGAFGFTRAVNEAVILNRSDVAEDRIYNGLSVAGDRSLSGVIAHEKCHGVLRRHFGLIQATLSPQMLVEGYCDHVARESSLTEEEVSDLANRETFHPAIPYFYGRKKVDEALAANGGSVDRLFAEWK